MKHHEHLVAKYDCVIESEPVNWSYNIATHQSQCNDNSIVLAAELTMLAVSRFAKLDSCNLFDSCM